MYVFSYFKNIWLELALLVIKGSTPNIEFFLSFVLFNVKVSSENICMSKLYISDFKKMKIAILYRLIHVLYIQQDTFLLR